MVSEENSADEVPEKNELGDAEATFKSTSKSSSSVANDALENKPVGAKTSSNDTSEDSSADEALEKEPGGGAADTVSNKETKDYSVEGMSFCASNDTSKDNSIDDLENKLGGEDLSS